VKNSNSTQGLLAFRAHHIERFDIMASTSEDIRPVENQTRALPREKAVEFLTNHTAEEALFTYEEEKATLGKIDKRVLVLILWAYFFQQLDKSSLRYISVV
jgi:hypothetical protein